MTHKQIYNEFCNWSPNHGKQVVQWKPWGRTSIVVWLSNGQAYKVKRYEATKFVMQMVSKEDIEKKGVKRDEDN